MKSKVISLCLVAIMVFTSVFSGCKKSEEKSGESAESSNSVESSEESSESESDITEKKEPSKESSEEPKKITEIPEGNVYTTGNINFSYSDDVTLEEINGLPYFYYNDTSFYFAESLVGDIGSDDIDEAFATEYFNAMTESFKTDPWTDGELEGPPVTGEFNGLNVWIGEAVMLKDGVQFIASTALVYYDGVLTNLTLISDEESYITSATAFAEVIKSMSPAE